VPSKLSQGDIADVWHEATRSFYEASILGAVDEELLRLLRPATPRQYTEEEDQTQDEWHYASSFRKRVSGFAFYFVSAFVALLRPVEIDKAVRDVLNNQFRDIP
jgi:hypothetical protein